MSKNVKYFSKAWRKALSSRKEVKVAKSIYVFTDEDLMCELKQCLLSGDVAKIEWVGNYCEFSVRYKAKGKIGPTMVNVRLFKEDAILVLSHVPIIPFRFFIEEYEQVEHPCRWLKEKGGIA